jgi:hypothetical protein
MNTLERAVQSAWDELENQGQVSKFDAPFVDRSALLIDGTPCAIGFYLPES